MAERFCVRCGRGFAGADGGVLCDDCTGAGSARLLEDPAPRPVAVGRRFASEESVPAEWAEGDVLLDLYAQ